MNCYYLATTGTLRVANWALIYTEPVVNHVFFSFTRHLKINAHNAQESQKYLTDKIKMLAELYNTLKYHLTGHSSLKQVEKIANVNIAYIYLTITNFDGTRG
jgi:hypothetical protein